jgi:hypothetical protein
VSGDAVSAALTNAVLELSADVKDLTKAVERQVQSNERVGFQSTRIANASENTQAMAFNEVQAGRTEKQALAEQLGKLNDKLGEINEKLAVLVDNVKDAEKAADAAAEKAGEASTEAKRAAENSRTGIILPPRDLPPPPPPRDPGPPEPRHVDAPEREIDDAPSDKSAVGYGFRAFALFVRAKGDTKAWLLALIALIGIFVLAYFNIVNKNRADEMEHEGAAMHGARK